jgi:hypothetical protein
MIEGYVIQNSIQMIVYGLVAIVIGGPFARVLARRLDRRDVHPQELRAIEERLARIEATVESTAVEVERVSELQRFTSRVVTGDLPPRDDRRPLSASTTR